MCVFVVEMSKRRNVEWEITIFYTGNFTGKVIFVLPWIYTIVKFSLSTNLFFSEKWYNADLKKNFAQRFSSQEAILYLLQGVQINYALDRY